MAGAKTAPEKIEQEVPPHEAGREVLSYVQQQEKEADELFAEVHGVEEPEKKDEGDAKDAVEETEKKAEDKEPEKKDDEEPADKELEGKDKVADGDDDLTKGLNTENATKRISAAQNKMHDSNARAKTAEEEKSKLQTENEALLKKLEEKSTAPAAAAAEPGKEAEAKEAPKSDDDELQASLDELSQEYPEIAKPMLKMMAKQEVENKRLTEKVDNLEAKEVKREADVKTEKLNGHLKAISDVHKDFKEISEEPLLDEWIEGLPVMERAGAQAIRQGGSTDDVIELLTTFKKANGYELPAASKEDTPEKKGNSKIDKAKSKANPSFNKAKDVNIAEGKAPFTRIQINAMSMEEYAKNEPAIDDAMSKGFPPQ